MVMINYCQTLNRMLLFVAIDILILPFIMGEFIIFYESVEFLFLFNQTFACSAKQTQVLHSFNNHRKLALKAELQNEPKKGT